MKKKLKILAASDFHEDRRAVKKLAEKAEKEKVDLVILCGDFTFFDNDWKGMVGPFLEKNKRVLFVPGNHDSYATTELLTEKYRITNLQHEPLSVEGVGIFGCGGANVGPNLISERDLFSYLKKNYKSVRGAEKKIMVTHVHPTDSLIEKFSFPGSKAVKRAIDEFKPDIHLCGHIHETEGLEEDFGTTKSICVGKQGIVFSI